MFLRRVTYVNVKIWVFISTSENGTLILHFKKVILKIATHCKYFCLFYKFEMGTKIFQITVGF